MVGCMCSLFSDIVCVYFDFSLSVYITIRVVVVMFRVCGIP